MKQWGFYFDQTRCVACKTCVVACKEWNSEKRGDANIKTDISSSKGDMFVMPTAAAARSVYMKENWRRVSSAEYSNENSIDVVNLSIGCNHCDNPACVEICPAEAITKDKNTGIVSNDSSKCISCGMCADNCPYGAPQYYDNIAMYDEDNPNIPRMTKCNMCQERLAEGMKPACVASCVNRALEVNEVAILKKKYKDATFRSIQGFDGEETGANILFKPKKSKLPMA